MQDSKYSDAWLHELWRPILSSPTLTLLFLLISVTIAVLSDMAFDGTRPPTAIHMGYVVEGMEEVLGRLIPKTMIPVCPWKFFVAV